MSQEFTTSLADSKQILILLALNPRFDEVAAGLSLFLSMQNKYQVSIACPSPMVVEFNRLVGVNRVSTELGNKNMTIRLKDYPADNVDRVSYDIEKGEFKLTVVPKPEFNAPNKDQVDISYSGLSADTVILIGGDRDDHFPTLASKEIENAKLIHVGTKESKFSKQVISLSTKATSISEVVANIIKSNELTMEADIATNLLMGIDEGSQGFSSSDVSAETFALASELMRAGGRRIAKQELPDSRNFPPGSIPGRSFNLPTGQAPQYSAAGGPRPPKSWYQPKVYKGGGVPTN